MMLTYDEQKKIERLATRDEEIRNMIATIKSDYHLTVSQISHEIRNPLTYINSSVQWIQKMHPEVEDFEFWGQIKNDLQYMRLLLDDISAFNNGDQLNICQIDLKAFACDLKDTLLAELLRCHIPLILKTEDSYPAFYGDPVRLKQALLNLLKNSMESITGRGKITLKIYVHDKRLLIAVKDNGCGIPPGAAADHLPAFRHLQRTWYRSWPSHCPENYIRPRRYHPYLLRTGERN